MASPSKQRLSMLLKKSDAAVYKPLTSLPKGLMIDITSFSYKQSIYPDATSPGGNKPFNLIPYFTFANTKMYTYLTREYNSSDEANIKETVEVFNADIKKGVAMKFVYYGTLDNTAKAKIHFDDEEIDSKLLAEVELWENNQKANRSPMKTENGSPTKRPRTDFIQKIDLD